jgi:5,10-methylenetetrahydrofolate reductase
MPMQRITEAYAAAREDDRPLLLCDVSPPRGADVAAMAAIAAIPVNFYCVAYAPGRAVRLDSLIAAHLIARETGRGAIFNLATRDMNLLALQNHLLAAHALGMPNVMVVRGDDFTARDRERVRAVHDVTPSALLAAVSRLNEGVDFRGAKIDAPVQICAGASLDLTRGHEQEAKLTARKVHAGAAFLISQPIYHPREAEEFLATYAKVNGEQSTAPVFWGFPVLTKDSLTLGSVPAAWREALEAGRSGADLAAEVLEGFYAAGLRALYVVPPILRGGARDYAATAAALGVR